MQKQTLVVLVCMAITMFSCKKKDSDPSPSVFYLKKITTNDSLTNTSSVTAYEYNEKDLLIKSVTTSSAQSQATTVYEYNADNKLAFVRVTFPDSENRYTIIYNNQNLVSEVIYSSQQGFTISTDTISYEYNGTVLTKSKNKTSTAYYQNDISGYHVFVLDNRNPSDSSTVYFDQDNNHIRSTQKLSDLWVAAAKISYLPINKTVAALPLNSYSLYQNPNLPSKEYLSNETTLYKIASNGRDYQMLPYYTADVYAYQVQDNLLQKSSSKQTNYLISIAGLISIPKDVSIITRYYEYR